MPKFSKVSELRLSTCDPRLQLVAREAIKRIDFVVLCGHRGQEAQDEAVAQGKSKLRWPHSRHNRTPAAAMDLAPYPLDWQDTDGFKRLAEVILQVARELGVAMEWGGDWPALKDMDHFQLATIPTV